MSAITWADVIAHAPTLTLAESARPDVLRHANTHFNPASLGGENGHTLRLARIYLAAHLSSVAVIGGSSGAIMSESEGGLSRTYSVAATGDALQATMWGRLLDGLLRASPARAGYVL